MQDCRCIGHGHFGVSDTFDLGIYLSCGRTSGYLSSPLQHDDTDTTTLRSVNLVLRIDTRRQVFGAVVEQVVVQLAVASTKFLVGKEQRIVEKCQGVEDVKFGLGSGLCQSCLRENKITSMLTCLARIRASLTSWFRRVLRMLSSSSCFSKALSVA